MGSENIKADKAEKKRLKAQYKLDKKRAKLDAGSGREGGDSARDRSDSSEPEQKVEIADKMPWYKDPAWVRAIATIASLVVAIIVAFFTLL